MTRPITATHPARRQRRLSQGAPAGQRRREHPDADCGREPAGREESEIGVGRRHDRSLVDVDDVGEQRHEERGDRSAECHGDRREPSRPDRRPQQAAHQHRDDEQARPGDQQGQEPVGERVDTAEEVGCERRNGVTEQPRQEEDEDDRNSRHDQAEDVGR